MKAELDAQGLMTLRPETEHEADALMQWVSAAFMSVRPGMQDHNEVCVWRGSRLAVDLNLESK